MVIIAKTHTGADEKYEITKQKQWPNYMNYFINLLYFV